MSFDLQIKNGDVTIGSNGDFQKIQDTDKLLQDVLKIATTEIGANSFYPWYGSPASKALIGNALSTDIATNQAATQLTNALETLQKLQQAQAASQNITAMESLAAVQNVSVVRNAVDPRIYSVSIRILTKALTAINPQFSIS